MVYIIVNAPTPCTLEARDAMTACAAAIILGHGRYGLVPAGYGPAMPPDLGPDAEAWFERAFGRPIGPVYEAYRRPIADALDSVVPGLAIERRAHRAALAARPTAAARRAWFQARYGAAAEDRGALARELAYKLRVKQALLEKTRRQ